MSILTLGHSTHDPVTFKRLLAAADCQGILDVRSHPTSKWPWWHREPAAGWLNRAGFRYEWVPALGGWDVRHADLREWAAERGVKLDSYLRGHFPKQRIAGERIPTTSGAEWTNQGLYDYAWFTALPEFREALHEVVDCFADPSQPNMALVCAEAMWWKCHRSMIADVLTHWGIDVTHIMPSGRNVRLSEHPDNRLDRYPDEVREAWNAQRP